MKRFGLFALTLALAIAAGSAEGAILMDKGTIDVNAGLGLGFNHGDVAIEFGGEYVLGKFLLAKELPLTWGLAARGGSWLGSDPRPAAAVLGTLHFSWSSIKWPKDLEWLDKFDSYLGLGLQILPDIGLGGIVGISYFFANNLAVNLESGINSSTIGIMLKL